MITAMANAQDRPSTHAATRSTVGSPTARPPKSSTAANRPFRTSRFAASRSHEANSTHLGTTDRFAADPRIDGRPGARRLCGEADTAPTLRAAAQPGLLRLTGFEDQP